MRIRTPATRSSSTHHTGESAAAIAPRAYGVDFIDAAARAERADSPTEVVQRLAGAAPRPQHAQTARAAGLPDALQAGIEGLSGLAMDDVRVHYGSAQPAALGALAFTRGGDIHVAPGQEQHLPHEAWHVVQQKQGRVHTTTRQGDVPVNNEAALEREADTMGARAEGFTGRGEVRVAASAAAAVGPVQCKGSKNARLRNATLTTTHRDEPTIKGHNMSFELDLDIPNGAKVKVTDMDSEIARSLYGVSFQWWEEIIEEYNFDEPNPALVGARKATGDGRTYKSWSDIYLANPQSQTFYIWQSSLNSASAGGLSGNHKTGLLDAPALNLGADSYKSRTLRFRIQAQDAFGKVFKLDAIQVLKADDGVLTSSYYADSTGTELTKGAGDFEAMRFRSTIDPAVLRNDVPSFAAKAPKLKGGVRDFQDVELDQVMAGANTMSAAYLKSNRTIIHKGMQQGNKLNGVPLIPQSDHYLEYTASDGGLLVAHMSGKRIVRMFYTKNVPHTISVAVNSVPTPMSVRGFEQVPPEAFAPNKKR